MLCPSCAAPLVPYMHEDVRLEACPAGHGLWLDNDRLLQVVRSTQQDRPAAEEQWAEEMQGTVDVSLITEGDRACPQCKAAMRKQTYAYQSGVLMDVCPSGHGLWLDHGELERIEAWVEGSKGKAAQEQATWSARLDLVELESDRAAAREAGNVHWGPVGALVESISAWWARRDDRDRA